MLVEFRWLVERIDVPTLRAVSAPLVGDVATARLVEIVRTAVPSMQQLQDFREVIQPRLDSYRMYGKVDGLRRQLTREIRWVWTAAVNWQRGLKTRSTRVSPSGGLSVCVVGAQPDATSLARQLSTWLSTDMAVMPDLGAASTNAARRARGRGKVVIADRLRSPDPLPVDLAIILGDVPFPNGDRQLRAPAQMVKLNPTDTPERLLLNAKCALWESI
jgi:hypothetical protein